PGPTANPTTPPCIAAFKPCSKPRGVDTGCLIPVVTLIGLQAAFLLGGAVVTETMFSWPGVGRLAVGAIVSSDFPTAQGAIMILAIAFLMINLIVDVLYVYLDPRVQKS
ncbi:MAG: ABC transporter permease, partial [Burkholderiaceae bacterium]|nr:ABC transporter permease [Burkholderiaceae bacterium]